VQVSDPPTAREIGTFGTVFALLQREHAPNFRDCGFRELSLPLGQPCAFGIEPHGAFLFWAELLQSHAHTHKLNQLPPIGRFAVNHASILPPAGRNLPQGREQRKCLPRFGQRAGVASAGVGY
jgi:hypothetical protein